MFKYDYQYLEKLVTRAESHPENSYTELFAATYRDQYRFAQIFISDPVLIRELLTEAYIQSFSNLQQLQHPCQFLYYLTQTLFNLCLERLPKDTPQYLLLNFANSLSPREKQIFVMKHLQHMPDSTIASALDWTFMNVFLNKIYVNKKYRSFCRRYNFSLNVRASRSMTRSDAEDLLFRILDSLELSHPNVPLSLLEKWGNYKKPGSPTVSAALDIAIIMLALLPMFFLHPDITVERTDVNSNTSAKYKIKVASFLPLSSVQGSIDGNPLLLSKGDNSTYYCDISTNGILTFSASALNGQVCTKELEADQLDKECPKLINSSYEGTYTVLTVQDTYSGVDYDRISGTNVVSYDKESGTITFITPDQNTSVHIPDHAGNILNLTLHSGRNLSD